MDDDEEQASSQVMVMKGYNAKGCIKNSRQALPIVAWPSQVRHSACGEEDRRFERHSV